jgi:UDP-glucose 4-epimerase
VAGIDVVIGDAGDPETVQRLLHGIDHVVYVAGGLDPPTAAQRPLDDAVRTLSPLLCTLEALRHHPDASFTYVSSGGAVYGNPVNTVAGETDMTQPISPYGVSRLAGESYCRMYATTFGIATRIVRCANAYGPGQSHSRPQGAVAVFLNRVAAGRTATIFGDGTSTRDYVHVDDIASVVSQLVLSRVNCGVVNVGSGSGHTVVGLLKIIAETVGREPVTEFVAPRPFDVHSIVLDISKLRSLIQIDPTPLDAGVRATWMSRNLEGSAV